MNKQIKNIIEEISEFKKLQDKYSEFGARDTEPDYLFQLMLFSDISGRGSFIPNSVNGWQLFDIKGSIKIAAELTHKAKKISSLIKEVKLKDYFNLLEIYGIDKIKKIIKELYTKST